MMIHTAPIIEAAVAVIEAQAVVDLEANRAGSSAALANAIVDLENAIRRLEAILRDLEVDDPEIVAVLERIRTVP